MRIRLLTITHKVPAWIKEGYHDYIKRLPPAYTIELIEIPAEKRHADVTKILAAEDEKMLAMIKPRHRVIALDRTGEIWSTEDLKRQLHTWQHEGQPIDLLVGGPDGLGSKCLASATQKWSLSHLTFPHALVRIMLAEQIYRAYSLLNHLPYHR